MTGTCRCRGASPWARQTRGGHRRAAAQDTGLGGNAYDDRIIRARLAQAFGRLIRNREDKGHFVVLSAAFPSRLLTAFPKGTVVRRLTLDEALERITQGLVGEGPEQTAEIAGPLDDGIPDSFA